MIFSINAAFFKSKTMAVDQMGNSASDQFHGNPETEMILEELFHHTNRGNGYSWWLDLPNAERIKDMVRRRICDSGQRGGNMPGTEESPGTAFMEEESQSIQDLTGMILEIVNRVIQAATAYDDPNKPVTVEFYDRIISPRIMRELGRYGIPAEGGSDAAIILEKMKRLFTGLSNNDLRAGDEVCEIMCRRTHQ